jgi:hypothetical protein
VADLGRESVLAVMADTIARYRGGRYMAGRDEVARLLVALRYVAGGGQAHPRPARLTGACRRCRWPNLSLHSPGQAAREGGTLPQVEGALISLGARYWKVRTFVILG